MTEWDKLWETPEARYAQWTTKEGAWIRQVKAMGDKLQEKADSFDKLNTQLIAENFKLQEENKQLRGKNNILRVSNETWERAFNDTLTERDRFLQKLEALQGENKQLRTRISEYFFTTKEQEKKLDAIRKLVDEYGKNPNIDPSSRLIKILEVLGE